MPTFCYTDNTGKVHERYFPSGKSPKKVKTENGWAYRDFVAEHAGIPSGERGWPIKSDALSIHPDQVAEYTAFDSAGGVPTQYTPDGRPILRSREHRKRYCQLHGFYDRNAGYGDPAPQNRR